MEILLEFPAFRLKLHLRGICCFSVDWRRETPHHSLQGAELAERGWSGLGSDTAGSLATQPFHSVGQKWLSTQEHECWSQRAQWYIRGQLLEILLAPVPCFENFGPRWGSPTCLYKAPPLVFTVATRNLHLESCYSPNIECISFLLVYIYFINLFLFYQVIELYVLISLLLFR